MKERDLEQQCAQVLRRELPGCYIWKIRDETTAGQPDLEVAWGGHTTKFEFKLMKRDENVHEKWEDRRQLITCVRYEGTTTRCWIVAYRRADKFLRPDDQTLIYRPTSLLDGKLPPPSGLFSDVNRDNLPLLWSAGVIALRGFNHGAVADLVRLTHQ